MFNPTAQSVDKIRWYKRGGGESGAEERPDQGLTVSVQLHAGVWSVHIGKDPACQMEFEVCTRGFSQHPAQVIWNTVLCRVSRAICHALQFGELGRHLDQILQGYGLTQK